MPLSYVAWQPFWLGLPASGSRLLVVTPFSEAWEVHVLPSPEVSTKP